MRTAEFWCLTNLVVEGNGCTKLVRAEASLHDLHESYLLGVGNDRLCLAVDGEADVAVEVMHVGRGAWDLAFLDGVFVSGGHGLGKTGGGDYGNDVLILPVLAGDDMAIVSPEIDDRASVCAGHVVAGKLDKVRGISITSLFMQVYFTAFNHIKIVT